MSVEALSFCQQPLVAGGELNNFCRILNSSIRRQLGSSSQRACLQNDFPCLWRPDGQLREKFCSMYPIADEDDRRIAIVFHAHIYRAALWSIDFDRWWWWTTRTAVTGVAIVNFIDGFFPPTTIRSHHSQKRKAMVEYKKGAFLQEASVRWKA